MAFRVGQKVEVINISPNAHGDVPNLRIGERFIIAEVNDVVRYGCVGVKLRERRANASTGFFKASRFRPIVEKSTDAGMAVLRKILDRQAIEDRDPYFSDIISDIDR